MTEILKESYGISEDDINTWFIDTYKDRLFSGDFYSAEFLENLCVFPVGYNLILDNLPELLHKHGMLLYGQIGAVIGPIKELIENQHCCFEFDRN